MQSTRLLIDYDEFHLPEATMYCPVREIVIEDQSLDAIIKIEKEEDLIEFPQDYNMWFEDYS